MSLKAFHIVFIVASILLALGLGAWEVKAWLDTRRPLDLVFGVGSLVAGIGLIIYGRYFLKKLKQVPYL
jgi:predicted membrane-bound spermidine synthase